MPVTVAEQYASNLSSRSGELAYRVAGALSIIEAYNAVASTAPSSINGIPRSDIVCDEVPGTNPIRYNARVSYGFKGAGTTTIAPIAMPANSFQFEINTSTETFYTSKQLIQTKPTGTDAPDVGTFLEEGASAYEPVTSFTYTAYLNEASVTGSYLASLSNLRSKTNNASVSITAGSATLTFAEGELLYLGFTGGLVVDQSYWKLDHKFIASPNATGITVAGITGVNKKGFEYAEIIYQKYPDDNISGLVKKAIAVRVHRMYDTGTFDVF